jgi:plasmid stabilization system protein ParE
VEAIRKMNYVFHPEAEKELLEAINYYEGRKNGLGYEFAREVYTAIDSILEYPQAWPLLEDDIHRRLYQYSKIRSFSI